MEDNSGNLLDLGTYQERIDNHIFCARKENVTTTYPLGGGPCGGAYDGVYPEWKGEGGPGLGAPNPPLGRPKKQSVSLFTAAMGGEEVILTEMENWETWRS